MVGAEAKWRGLSLACGAVAAIATVGACSNVGGAPGWRLATAADVAKLARDQTIPASEVPVDQKLAVSADFDGDGREDKAALMLNDGKGLRALFVFPGAGGAPIQLTAGEASNDLWNQGLGLVEPGVYATACGKGMGDAAAPCRPKLTLRNSAVELFTYEAGGVAFFWNGRAFEREWLTD